jgi:hypothetical protein
VEQKRAVPRSPLVTLYALALPAALAAACSATGGRAGTGSPAATTSGGTTAGPTTGASASSSGAGGGAAGSGSTGAGGAIALAPSGCSEDLHAVVDALGNVVTKCTGTSGCDRTTLTCSNACAGAVENRLSVGCEYFATDMDQFSPGLCFAAFVANTWDTPAHLEVEYAGAQLPIAAFARIPSGAGPTLSYAPYDPVVGLPPGQVAILFLAGSTGSGTPCPVLAAVSDGAQVFQATGVGSSFRITADVPVVAYEMNPYGGGSAAVTGASLLLPTSVWGTNYVAVTAAPYDPEINKQGTNIAPSINIVAAADGTEVTLLPSVAVAGGGALPPGAANVPYTFTLNKGQQAQLTQQDDLTGTVIQSTKPVGLMAGHPCMRAPLGVAYCDHGEQMIPPVKALGSEYVGVMFKPRVIGDAAIWRVVGVVEGTVLSYTNDVGGPKAVSAGETIDFVTADPFVVKSQDADHPFMFFTYMSGSQWGTASKGPLFDTGGYGDADFVLGVPPQQYDSAYVFFADPTYPETSIVLVRAHDANGHIHDVSLDCAGAVSGWQTVGDYEWARVNLTEHEFESVGGCSSGRHEIKSKGPFGLWVWGWGTPETTQFTANVSYGYPGGMNVRPINSVVVLPTPK